jgi:carbamoyl-phosphate synthase small subunit
VHARAVIMREAMNYHPSPATAGADGWLDWLASRGIPALSGVDTRTLVRHIRDEGAMRGGVFGAELAESQARDMIGAEPPMKGLDLARAVTPSEPVTLRGDSSQAAPGASGARVVALDTGIKTSIVRELLDRGCEVTLLPCTSSAADVLEREPDAAFLANGPGDPAALGYVVETVRELVGRLPVFGICLGHQLLCRAVGLETFKLRFGHRGANHPVKDLGTGKIEITAQNHGFAVVGPGGERTLTDDQAVRWETDFGTAELSHLNLYDRTVEGLVLHDVPAACVQYHPEAGPGPHDSLYLFDRFLELVA